MCAHLAPFIGGYHDAHSNHYVCSVLMQVQKNQARFCEVEWADQKFILSGVAGWWRIITLWRFHLVAGSANHHRSGDWRLCSGRS